MGARGAAAGAQGTERVNGSAARLALCLGQFREQPCAHHPSVRTVTAPAKRDLQSTLAPELEAAVQAGLHLFLREPHMGDC